MSDDEKVKKKACKEREYINQGIGRDQQVKRKHIKNGGKKRKCKLKANESEWLSESE